MSRLHMASAKKGSESNFFSLFLLIGRLVDPFIDWSIGGSIDGLKCDTGQ